MTARTSLARISFRMKEALMPVKRASSLVVNGGPSAGRRSLVRRLSCDGVNVRKLSCDGVKLTAIWSSFMDGLQLLLKRRRSGHHKRTRSQRGKTNTIQLTGFDQAGVDFGPGRPAGA